MQSRQRTLAQGEPRPSIAHEREGLEHVRDLLPERGPLPRVEQLRVPRPSGEVERGGPPRLGEGRLHLVELKHYRGRLGGTPTDGSAATAPRTPR